MASNVNVPVKTPEAVAELSSRQRKLGQRQRTVLLLVDGKRSARQVKQLALQAGASDTCYDELVSLGMIAEPAALSALRPNASPPDAQQASEALEFAAQGGDVTDALDAADVADVAEEVATAFATNVATDMAKEAPPAPAAEIDEALLAAAKAGPRPDAHDSVLSVLPASLSLQHDSSLHDSVLDEPVSSDLVGLNALAQNGQGGQDAVFEEARAILIRAVRTEAPVAGSLTLLRLRRARTRQDLAALLQEVELRITKPFKGLWAAQTMSRVREMLAVHTLA